MIKEFRASDGTLVWTSTNAEGDVKLGNYMTLSPKEAQAFREFFQHERDEELGRWRWPEDPGYVVMSASPKTDVVNVTNERKGVSAAFSRADIGTHEHHRPFNRAAAAYFDAHPEPKPWHNAKQGEVWALTYRNILGEEVTEVAMRISSDKWRLPMTETAFDDSITAGRRIWPELS